MHPRVWRSYLLLALGGTAVYPLVPDSVWKGDVAFDLWGALAVVAVLVGVRLNRPREPAPWLLLAGGQGLFVAGDVVFSLYDHLAGSTPFPSAADGLYLAGYPVLAAGLVLLVRSRRPGQDWPSLLDAAIVTVGLGWFSWSFLMAPYLHDGSLSLAERSFSLAYPLGDVLLLAVAARLLFGGGGRCGSLLLLGAAIVVLLGGDSVYGWMTLAGSYESGSPVDTAWIASYALFGAAALHPSMAGLSERFRAAEPRFTRWRLALLAAAMVAGPATVAAKAVRDVNGESLGFPVAGLLLVVLAVARLGGVILRDERTVRREAVLREAGAALVQAGDSEAICDAGVRAALSLVQDERASSALALGPEGELTVVASAGPAAQPAGAPLRLDDASARAFPLVVGDHVRGVLAVSSPGRVPSETGDGLEVLAGQISLALESQELAEEVFRRRGEERFRSLVQSSTDLIVVVDPDFAVRYQTPSVQTVLGYEEQELSGESWRRVVHPEDAPRLRSLLTECLRSPQARPTAELRLLHRDGAYRRFETVASNQLADPNVGGIILTGRDVTERTALEEQLRRKVFEDGLTGLATGELFRNRLEHALARRSDRELAVLVLDLDDFGDVNDSLGHAAGDAILVEAAWRIGAALRSGDTAARLGGDEFAVLLDDLGDPRDAVACADRIVEALARPFVGGGREVVCSASVGVKLTRHGRGEVEQVIQHAALAMSEAKRAGKARSALFDPTMEDGVVDRLERVAELRHALDRDELLLHFQPILDLKTGLTAGLEALVRWRHPGRGIVPPAEFVPLAESTGLIVPLGRWVLGDACSRFQAWRERGLARGPVWISVNLSVCQLRDAGLVDDVRNALAESGLDPAALVLELTESVVAEDVDAMVERMLELKRLGVRLAVDDFGSGFSALSYLRRLPVDILKIDRQFVADLDGGSAEAELAATIVHLGRTLGLEVVAEGIETQVQSRRLRELECPLGQGYLYGPPVDADAAAARLADEGSAAAAVA
ncbi:MAG TPA: EAL domain-containing protein [Gaiellaceae bacterium]|nr:EAL domain-containing protein [Gaiellaceae bacterium]